MKTLLALAALVLVSPLSAQTPADITIVKDGEAVVAVTRIPGINQVIGFRGYLLTESDLDSASYADNLDEGSYAIRLGGLEMDYSIHGGKGVVAWKDASVTLEWILKIAQRSGKRTGSIQLAEGVAEVRRTIKAIATDKKAGEIADGIGGGCEREPSSKYFNVDVQALNTGADQLEIKTLKAKTEAEHVTASVAIDTFKLALPK